MQLSKGEKRERVLRWVIIARKDYVVFYSSFSIYHARRFPYLIPSLVDGYGAKMERGVY